jgi:hypothetical protein
MQAADTAQTLYVAEVARAIGESGPASRLAETRGSSVDAFISLERRSKPAPCLAASTEGKNYQ